ncbi:MAG: HD domain-containing protein [Acidobacteriota bacterium]
MSADLLDLLSELQSLDRIPRLGYAQRGVTEPESVAEHLFHVVFLVWALAPRVDGLDVARAVDLAMVHDLAEVRFGDLPRTAAHYLPDGAKASAEAAASRDLLAPLGEERAALFDEYQARETREARFVAVCDKLQLLIKAAVYERWNAGAVGEFLDRLDAFDDAGFVPIREVIEALRRRRAAS